MHQAAVDSMGALIGSYAALLVIFAARKVPDGHLIIVEANFHGCKLGKRPPVRVNVPSWP